MVQMGIAGALDGLWGFGAPVKITVRREAAVRYSMVSLGFPAWQVCDPLGGALRAGVQSQRDVFPEPGGPWPGLPGHPAELHDRRAGHHLAEHAREHPVHGAAGFHAVRPLCPTG